MYKWNDQKIKNHYNRTLKHAKEDKYNFTDKELEKTYLDNLSHKTKSPRIMRMISLAYYLGKLKGIQEIDEGKCSRKVANLEEFWNGQKEIKLLDPNLLAAKEHLGLLDELIESNAWIDVTQGFDIRLTTPQNIEKIKQLKIKMLHFAWDKEKDEKMIIEKLRQFKELTGLGYRKLRVYILTNFDTTFEYDLYRVYKLKELGYDPYVMIYEKWNSAKNIRHLQRWVNCKFIFRSASARTFEEYKSSVS